MVAWAGKVLLRFANGASGFRASVFSRIPGVKLNGTARHPNDARERFCDTRWRG